MPAVQQASIAACLVVGHAVGCDCRSMCTCRVLHNLYEGTLGEYWDDRRRLVESHYQGG